MHIGQLPAASVHQSANSRTVDSFWDADDASLQALLQEVLSQHSSIGVGVVAANDHNAVQIMSLGSLQWSGRVTNIRCVLVSG